MDSKRVKGYYKGLNEVPQYCIICYRTRACDLVIRECAYTTQTIRPELFGGLGLSGGSDEASEFKL